MAAVGNYWKLMRVAQGLNPVQAEPIARLTATKMVVQSEAMQKTEIIKNKIV